jgi:adenosylhomocysteine nucleosidase
MRESFDGAEHGGILVVAALRDETKNRFEALGVQTLYTGIGKVNAAYFLAQALTRMRLQGTLPRAVLNVGTAGSPVFQTHALVECTRFVQRDMDLSPLGFARGVTPFEDAPSAIDVPRRLPALPRATCGTGDSFETGALAVPCDVVDMEAFALAKICHLEGMPFMAVKYVSDGCDHNAHNDWNENLHRAAAGFIAIFAEVVKVLRV